MSFISTVTMQYDYFTAQLPEFNWSNAHILDFGGNVGNILTHPHCAIEHKNYWSLDVSKDAIVMGKHRYPNANFVFYDCYNFSFNPTGIPNLKIPDLGTPFDLIISYSIFTHTSKSEMVSKVTELLKQLKFGGKLLFTYLDPSFNPFKVNPAYRNENNFELRLKRLNNGFLNEKLVERNKNSEWSLLLNQDDLYIESEDHQEYHLDSRETYFSFFRSSFMKKQFPNAILLPPPLSAYPYNYVAEFQHTCMITK